MRAAADLHDLAAAPCPLSYHDRGFLNAEPAAQEGDQCRVCLVIDRGCRDSHFQRITMPPHNFTDASARLHVQQEREPSLGRGSLAAASPGTLCHGPGVLMQPRQGDQRAFGPGDREHQQQLDRDEHEQRRKVNVSDGRDAPLKYAQKRASHAVEQR